VREIGGPVRTSTSLASIMALPMSTRMLILLAACCAVAILAASAIQILLAR